MGYRSACAAGKQRLSAQKIRSSGRHQSWYAPCIAVALFNLPFSSPRHLQAYRLEEAACVTIRLLLLAGSQREILEKANVFLPVLPCNITAKPRATRESKIPITRRKKTAFFAFKELRWQLVNMSVVLCVQWRPFLGEYPNLWQAEWPKPGLLLKTYSFSLSCITVRKKKKTRPQRLPPRTSMEHYFIIFPPPRLESARHSSARLASLNTRSA